LKKLSNKQRRIIRNKYKKQNYHLTGENKPFTRKEFAILNDRYEKLSEDKKLLVNGYVNHQLWLFDIDPNSNKDEISNLIKTFRCEFLIPENKSNPDRTILRDRFNQMTPEERKHEIENDEVAQYKFQHMESTKDLTIDENDLQSLYAAMYQKWYDRGNGPGSHCDYKGNVQIEDEPVDMLDEWGKTG
jgi:hypothetical protein